LCDNLFAPLHILTFCKQCTKLSKEAMVILRSIGSYYLQEGHTHVRINEVNSHIHMFPKYVLNRMVLGDIAYQTIIHGFDDSLEKYSRRKGFIQYNMYIGHYGLSNSKFAIQEENAMLEYNFPQGKFMKNDPNGLVLKHSNYVAKT